MPGGKVTFKRRHDSPFSFHDGSSSVDTPSVTKTNSAVRYVHIAYPAKYASWRRSHGVSSAWPANESRGDRRSSTIRPSVVSIATRWGSKDVRQLDSTNGECDAHSRRSATRTFTSSRTPC